MIGHEDRVHDGALSEGTTRSHVSHEAIAGIVAPLVSKRSCWSPLELYWLWSAATACHRLCLGGLPKHVRDEQPSNVASWTFWYAWCPASCY